MPRVLRSELATRSFAPARDTTEPIRCVRRLCRQARHERFERTSTTKQLEEYRPACNLKRPCCIVMVGLHWADSDQWIQSSQ